MSWILTTNVLNFSLISKTSECSWLDWLPDPPDANPCQSRRYRQNADVFNMLVSVYGSKEIFVKEYRELLAERLTKSWNRDVSVLSSFMSFSKKLKFRGRSRSTFENLDRVFI